MPQPASSVSNAATQIGTPSSRSRPKTIAATATIEPTERSISPVTKTKVIDTANTPMNEICDAMLLRLSTCAKVELISAKMVPVIRMAATRPASRKYWRRRYAAERRVARPRRRSTSSEASPSISPATKRL